MNLSPHFAATPFRSAHPGRLRMLVPLALVLAAGGQGCFRATGLSRPSVAVEEIPSTGGDRVTGLKATAGPGDFFLGNDSVQLAVDGAVFGNREGQFGAASGGAVLDIGIIALDQSYHRVSVPSDLLERLGPVANQDPDLPLVFDRYTPSSDVNAVRLDMQGYLLDPKGKLGATTDGQGRVNGVTVTHRISLNKAETFYTLETTLTNASGGTLPLRNVGDFLSQHGAGFRFAVPARTAFDGTPLTNWGVDIPGSDFGAPLTSSVVAPMVALMGAESAADTFDSHSSLGIMPVDVDPVIGASVLVTSDPQKALTESRPKVSERLVVGGPAVASLASGQSIRYRRRLYVVGGASKLSAMPAQATSLFNLMIQGRAILEGKDVGYLSFGSFGTAARGGPLQTEFRVERYTYSGANPADTSHLTDPANWLLERVEWGEPVDIGSSNSSFGMLLPMYPDATTGLSQRYRFSARNALQQGAPLYLGTNVFVNPYDHSQDSKTPLLLTPITPSKTQLWQLSEALSPERDEVIDVAGNAIKSKQTTHVFVARQTGSQESSGLSPLRLTFQGIGMPDPNMQRIRQVSSAFSPIYKGKYPVSANFGAYQYTAANQVFGTAFGSNASTSMYFAPGDYLAYATRGPLSNLDSLPLSAFDGQSNYTHGFMVLPPTMPVGWTSFDLPAPTQATTGGFNPGEMLSSAVSEGVQVVARTEEDVLTDPAALRTEFRAEIDIAAISDAQRAPLGNDPFVVGARSATLADGFTTALFTPAPTTDRNGGARPSKGWSLEEFITQAEGAFTVVHQPRGLNGLFKVRGFDRKVALGTGINQWWNETKAASLGKRLGDFDAIELLRAEGCDPADPTAWYAEFGSVRDDWFAILNQQPQTKFTKGLGLSAARFSLDTPVGLARTYLKVGSTALTQDTLSPVLTALQSGAAVASTGPFLDVSINGVGPGGLVTGTNPSISLVINLYAPDWVPVDEVRVVVNGADPIQVPLASFTASATDTRLRSATVTVPMPTKDAWIVVEAGVSRTQSGPYKGESAPGKNDGTPWNKIMKGIYPIAITNPIFVDVNGGGYTPPGLN